MRHQMTHVAHQVVEQVVLNRCQLHRFPGDTNLLVLKVNGQITRRKVRQVREAGSAVRRHDGSVGPMSLDSLHNLVDSATIWHARFHRTTRADPVRHSLQIRLGFRHSIGLLLVARR
jgi:hypothetical protein